MTSILRILAHARLRISLTSRTLRRLFGSGSRKQVNNSERRRNLLAWESPTHILGENHLSLLLQKVHNAELGANLGRPIQSSTFSNTKARWLSSLTMTSSWAAYSNPVSKALPTTGSTLSPATHFGVLKRWSMPFITNMLPDGSLRRTTITFSWWRWSPERASNITSIIFKIIWPWCLIAITTWLSLHSLVGCKSLTATNTWWSVKSPGRETFFLELKSTYRPMMRRRAWLIALPKGEIRRRSRTQNLPF